MAKDEPAQGAGFFRGTAETEDATTVDADPGVGAGNARTPAPNPETRHQPAEHSTDFFTDSRGRSAPGTGFFGSADGPTGEVPPEVPGEPDVAPEPAAEAPPPAGPVPSPGVGFFARSTSTPDYEPPQYDDSPQYDDDPPTDPRQPAAAAPFVPPAPYDDFDPFAQDAYHPQEPWYGKPSSKLALVAIAVAAIALVIAAVLLLVTGGDDENPVDGVAPSTAPASSTTSPPSTTAPTTAPSSPAQPPPPPPPPPPPTAGSRTYTAPQPQYTQRPRSTWTRRTEAPDSEGPGIGGPTQNRPTAGRNPDWRN